MKSIRGDIRILSDVIFCISVLILIVISIRGANELNMSFYEYFFVAQSTNAWTVLVLMMSVGAVFDGLLSRFLIVKLRQSVSELVSERSELLSEITSLMAQQERFKCGGENCEKRQND